MAHARLQPPEPGYIPLKTSRGWAVVRELLDDTGVLRLAFARLESGAIILWKRRRDAVEWTHGIPIIEENRTLREQLRQLQEIVSGSGGKWSAAGV